VAQRVRLPLLAVLLAGPFVLAFKSGGYFDEPRLYAGLAACALVVIAAIASRRPLPQSRPGRLALAGLALLAIWVALSITWAPLSTPAVADADRLLLYLAGFTAALAVLDARGAVRALEPAVALGCLLVVGYGLSERVLPGVFELTRDGSAFGRLSQPISYWNAMGTVAALGFVLALRVAGDPTRRRWLRVAAAASAAPLGLGVQLPLSRGALGALVVGLVLLALLARDRAQLRAFAVMVPAGVIAAVCGSLLDGVRALAGGLAAREREGAIMLAVLVLLAGACAVAQLRLARRDPGRAASFRPLGRRGRQLIAAGFAVLVVAAFAVPAVLSERKPKAVPADVSTSRLTSTESNRYAYWRVALDAFAADPLKGTGSGGFQVVWLRERKIPEAPRDAHSLYLETAAELGLVGLAALALFLGGIGWSAARAYSRDPVAAAGLVAGVAVWAVHAGLDWLWELPAVSLPVLLLAAGLARTAEAPPDQPPGTGGAITRSRRSAASAAAGS
jgi:hypothetical protein